MRATTHLIGRHAVTACCGELAYLLPLGDYLTTDRQQVTCR